MDNKDSESNFEESSQDESSDAYSMSGGSDGSSIVASEPEVSIANSADLEEEEDVQRRFGEVGGRSAGLPAMRKKQNQ